MRGLGKTQGLRAQSPTARGSEAQSSETASPFPSIDGGTGKDRVKEDGAGQSLCKRFYDVIINSILVKISISSTGTVTANFRITHLGIQLLHNM